MASDDEMRVEERRKYLKRVAPRYAKARRAERSGLLTEMAAVTGLHRKRRADSGGCTQRAEVQGKAVWGDGS